MNSNEKIRKLAVTGLLAAITLVLGLTPLGIIPIPPANVTIMHLPVIIGTLVCGLSTGLILGAFFGAASIFVAFTRTSVLVAPLLAQSPVLVIIMSLGARLMIPVIVWLINRAITDHGTKRTKRSAVISSVAGSLTNTILYLGLMLIFYAVCGLDSAAVLGVIAGAGALNGSLEAVAAGVICAPVAIAVLKARSKKKIPAQLS